MDAIRTARLECSYKPPGGRAYEGEHLGDMNPRTHRYGAPSPSGGRVSPPVPYSVNYFGTDGGEMRLRQGISVWGGSGGRRMPRPWGRRAGAGWPRRRTREAVPRRMRCNPTTSLCTAKNLVPASGKGKESAPDC